MLLTILDWLGTLFVLIGSYIVTNKRASNPRVRLVAMFAYLLCTIFWIPMALILGAYGMLLAQLTLFFINLKGIRNCFKEMKYEG